MKPDRPVGLFLHYILIVAKIKPWSLNQPRQQANQSEVRKRLQSMLPIPNVNQGEIA